VNLNPYFLLAAQKWTKSIQYFKFVQWLRTTTRPVLAQTPLKKQQSSTQDVHASGFSKKKLNGICSNTAAEEKKKRYNL
jgi:hypothetical protein